VENYSCYLGHNADGGEWRVWRGGGVGVIRESRLSPSLFVRHIEAELRPEYKELEFALTAHLTTGTFV